MTARLYSFFGGTDGPWRIESQITVAGDPIAAASRLRISPTIAPTVAATAAAPERLGSLWELRGAVSNERYVVRAEKTELVARQAGLGRADARRAALSPIRKTAAWWALTQDERRRLFEEQSRHIGIGIGYLPAIARRLHHCRDLGDAEPFDFLTWFEYAADDEPAFERLLDELRATVEWSFVDREVDIRLARVD